MRFLFLALVASLVTPAVFAESHNPADYPLRIHIYRRSETTFYSHRVEEEAKGEGRANLFENGEPKGIDFQFECDQKLQTSSGFETFPAKWEEAWAGTGGTAAGVREDKLRHMQAEGAGEGLCVRQP